MNNKLSKPVNLKAKAIDLLSRREHSYQELFQKLKRYSDDEEAIITVLQEMLNKRFLNEERYVESFIHSKAKKYGSLKVKYLLSTKVKDTDLINKIYQQTQINEVTIACQHLRKKFVTPPENKQLVAKYLRFLINKGFGISIARQALAIAYNSTIDSIE